MKSKIITFILCAILTINCSPTPTKQANDSANERLDTIIEQPKIITKEDIQNLGISINKNETISYNTIKEMIKRTRLNIRLVTE